MCHPRRRLSLLLAIGSAAVLGPAGLALAACPVRPLPPCGPTALTGSVRAQVSRCVPPARVCRESRGPQGPRGASGRRGAVGARGATGLTGLTGVAGLAGMPGATGIQGQQGVSGDAGAVGAQGPTGTAGAQGPAGSVGAQGPVGPAGAVGAQGPAGPAGAVASREFAYVYNEGPAVVAIEADVPFDSNGVLSAGITHAPGGAGITFVTAGTYEVTFTLSGVEPSQMALFLNGASVAGAIYGSGAGTQPNTGQVIITADAGDVLTLRNHTSAAAVTLQTLAGGTQVNVNASILIEQLA